MADTWQKSGIEYIVKDSTETGTAAVLRSLQSIDKNLQSVTGNLQSVTGKMKGVAAESRGIGAELKAALAIGVGYLGISKLVSGYQEVSRSISDTAKAADILQISTESLSGLRYVAEQSDVAGTSLDAMMVKFTAFASRAVQGSASARYALQQLGLSGEELTRIRPDEALLRLADAFQKVRDPADRVRLALEIFGRTGTAGTQMIEILALGSAGIKTMTDRFRALGGEVTRVDVEKVRQANAALKDVKTILGAIRKEIVIQVAPYVAALAGGLADAAAAGGGFGATVTNAMESVAVAAATVLDILIKIENLKNSVALHAYDVAFEKDVFAQTKEIYAGQMKREGKKPWGMFDRGGVLYPPRWSQAEEIVRRDLTPAYEAGRRPLVQETNNAAQVQTYFGQLRQRAQGLSEQAEIKTRITEYGRNPEAGSNLPSSMPTVQELQDAEQALEDEEKAVERAANGMQRLRDRVEDMDAAIQTEIEVVRRAGDAHGKLGEIVRYEMTVRAAYGDDLDLVTRKLEEHRRQLELLARVDFSNKSFDDLGQSLTDLVFDFQNAAKYAEQFFNTLARRAVNEMIMQPFMAALKPGVAALFSGGGGMTSEGMATVARYHDGGTVGAVPETRYLPVGAADRYLASNERLIVARVGEEVLTKQESRRRRVSVYHEGGVVGEGGSSVAASGNAGQPSQVQVRISNPPGSPLEATGAQISFDGPTMIVGVILDNIRRGGAMRDQIRMTARGG